MASISDSLAIVRERIARATEKSGRPAQAVRLVAITKTLPVERIREAIGAGLTEFGENRVQEAAEKYGLAEIVARTSTEGKTERQGLRLHLVGSLQRNKAGRAASLFDCIQSIDRTEVVKALDGSYAPRLGMQKLPVLIQVNVTGEESKSGVSPADLPALADAVLSSGNLQGRGLMTIARLSADEGELRRTFATLRSLLENLKRSYGAEWTELSMGMSDDYEIAIEEGATLVRLGRILFGERQQ